VRECLGFSLSAQVFFLISVSLIILATLVPSGKELLTRGKSAPGGTFDILL